MNTFKNVLEEMNRLTLTENGGLARNTTKYKLYDMFALGGAYRNRTDEDCILLFKNALTEDPCYALKCLFYLRDCRGGQGERRFFRVCFHWFANHCPNSAKLFIKLIPFFGRWDDLFILFNTPVENDMIDFVKQQLLLDISCKTPSLLAKWMPSENASAQTTKAMARTFIKVFGLTSRQYRKTLVALREKIKIIETLMSQDRWDEIEFDKIPSKAGLKYRNAFARRDIIAKKYEKFIKSDDTKVNAETLFPYEIVANAVKGYEWDWRKRCYTFDDISEIDRIALEKYWNNLPDYCGDDKHNIMCVVDTSGSMTGKEASAPLNVAIALGMYCGEKLKGDFHNNFISFSSVPKFIEFEGIDFVDKVRRIYNQNLCDNTNLKATFDLLYDIAIKPSVNKSDIPDTIVVLSDMEIDGACFYGYCSKSTIKTMMEEQRDKWAAAGLKLPKLVYWNVDARNNTFLDDGENVTYVSGASPSTFKAVIAGKTGMDLMFDILNSDRYSEIIL